MDAETSCRKLMVKLFTSYLKTRVNGPLLISDMFASRPIFGINFGSSRHFVRSFDNSS